MLPNADDLARVGYHNTNGILQDFQKAYFSYILESCVIYLDSLLRLIDRDVV